MKRLLCFLIIGLGSSAQAQKSITDEMLNTANGTRLEIRSVFDPMPPTGYAPLRIVATNGTSSETIWRFNVNSMTQEYRRNNTISSSFALSTPPNSTQSAVFLAPMAPDYVDNTGYRSGHSFTVTLNEPKTQSFSSYDNRNTASLPAIAISKALADLSMSGLKDEIEERQKAASGYGGDAVFGSSFTAEDLPEDWLAFSGFDYVMMTDTEWQRVKPGVRNALLQWARLGGRLHFYSKEGSSSGLPANDPNYSLGQIETFSWNGTSLAPKSTIGRYWDVNQKRGSDLALTHALGDWPLLKALGKRSFGSWQVVAFLVIFGILVGPVNLFVLAPSGRRHRLFVTTPLLSLGASVAMVGIILFQDGIGGKGVRYVFINVEPAEATAYVTQKQTSRTGMLFGAGFEVKQPALIEPLALPSSDWVKLSNDHDSQPINLNQNGPSRGGNFFQSRAEQAQMIRSAIATRARLELQPSASPDAPPTLVSALGFTVEEMFYADSTGTVWTLKSRLLTGQKAELVKSDVNQLAAWWHERQESSKLAAFPQLVLKPQNHFFAKASAAPGFTQDTLSSIRWQQDEVVIYGSVTPP